MLEFYGMERKVLITDKVHEVLLTGLEDEGYDIVYKPNLNPSDLEAYLPELIGMVINSKILMYKDRIDKSVNLEFIARLGSGLEIIDKAYAESKGISVFNSPEGNRNAVAEHTMGMLLCLSNNLLKSDKEVREKIWRREDNRGFELEGKTLGIIGLGNTGQSLARKLSGWALDIVYYDPYLLNKPSDLDYISKVSLNELCRNADVISLHVPLTEETLGMVDAEFIRNCEREPVIVNTSRGKVVRTEDLLHALEEGRLKGACLDVFENEKPHHFTPEEDQLYGRLYKMDNVVLSPHVAGWTHESLYKIGAVLLDKIKSTDK